MGAQIEITDTGVEVEIHRFDNRDAAVAYLTTARSYTAKWQPLVNSVGFEFFTGPMPGQNASLRMKNGFWQVAFWLVGNVRARRDGGYEGNAVWRGEYQIGSKWLTVKNASGNAIAYASDEAAYSAARDALDRAVNPARTNP